MNQCKQHDIAGLYRIYHKDNSRTRDESFKANDRMLRVCREALGIRNADACKAEELSQAACPHFPHSLIKSTRQCRAGRSPEL